MYNIGILGAGTWGAALARMLANKGESVTVWSAVGEEIDSLTKTHTHKNLPGTVLPDSINYTKEISAACEGMDCVVFAVPSIYMRSTAKLASAHIKNAVIVSVAKGLEEGTLYTMSEVIEDEIKGRPVVALSGPTHAEEVAQDMLTTIVAASKDKNAAEKVQDIFCTDFMRVYTNTDIYGVELSGALKNIMALAAGMLAGIGCGDNAKAALITRGIAEMARLGTAIGCKMETFAGLAGIGDLVVTATSIHSRNNKAGYLIGKGMTAAEAVKEVGMVVEGLNALEGALALSRKYNVEMPIIEAVDSIVNKNEKPQDVVSRLMCRKRKCEF